MIFLLEVIYYDIVLVFLAFVGFLRFGNGSKMCLCFRVFVV